MITSKRVVAAVILCSLAACVHAAEFKSLFNGKDLSGWAGKEGLWSVKMVPLWGRPQKSTRWMQTRFSSGRVEKWATSF